MKIEVKIFATLRLKLGIAGLEINTTSPVSVRELLDLACQKIGKDILPELLVDGEIKKGTIILIDGKNVLHMEKLDTMIHQDCKVSLFPPAGGG